MRMTDGQIKETIAAARMAEKEKAIFLKHALASKPEARFVILWLTRRRRTT